MATPEQLQAIRTRMGIQAPTTPANDVIDARKTELNDSWGETPKYGPGYSGPITAESLKQSIPGKLATGIWDVVTGKKDVLTAVGLPGVKDAIDTVSNKLATGEINTVKALNERGKNLITDVAKSREETIGKPIDEQALGAIKTSTLEAGKGIVGGVGDIIANMVGPLIPQKVKDAFGSATTDAVTAIKDAWNKTEADTEQQKIKDQVNNFVGGLSESAKKNPDIIQGISNIVNAVFLEAGKGAEGKIKDVVKNTAEGSAPIIESTIKGVTSVGGKVLDKVDEFGNKIVDTASKVVDKVSSPFAKTEAQVAKESIDEAQKILNPTGFYTQGEKVSAYQKGLVTKEGSGILSRDVITQPVTKQTEVIQGLVDEGKISAKNLPSKNIEVLNQEARIADQGINDIVNRPELNKPFNKATANKVFDNVLNSAKKDLVFVAESTEEKAYQEVVNVAKEEMMGQSLNNSGLRIAIKNFNARMEKILGSDIYSGASESVGNARVTAAKDMRTALNNFLADNLESAPIKKTLLDTKVVNTLPSSAEYATGRQQAGSIYRSQLQKEAMLLNARDEIAFRAGRSIDKTKLSQWLKDHPTANRVIKYSTAGIVGGGILHEFGL